MPGKYTFIINTYPSEKRDAEITKTLDSIFGQTYKNFEVLIVENFKDTSNIDPILKNYEAKDQRINVINDPTKRLSHLFDIGWRNANTELLAYVADDVELTPNWLEEIDKEIHLDSKIGVASGPNITSSFPAGEMHRLYLISQSNFIFKILVWPYMYFTMGSTPLLPGNLFESGAYSLGTALRESVNFSRQEIDLATTSSMGIKKSVIEEIGGYDQRFNFNHADGDLFIRIKKAGYKITFNPAIVSYHHFRLGPSRNAYIIGLDTGKFYKKHIRPKSIRGIIGAILNILVLNFYWIYNAVRTGDSSQLKGISGFFRGIIS